jgi:methyltransferase family protein
MISTHVKDGSFADIGGLWGLTNEKVTVAIEAGCRTATMIDIVPLSHESWKAFDARAQSLGITNYKKLPGNVDDPALAAKAGSFEFVHCSGVIYHVPNPLHTLTRLHALTRRFLLLVSMTVPERILSDTGEISFAGGRVVFLPAVDAQTKSVLAQHFRGLGINLGGICNDHYPWTSPGTYQPWWWLWTVDTLSAMLRLTGFQIVDAQETWKGRAHGILCEKRS